MKPFHHRPGDHLSADEVNRLVDEALSRRFNVSAAGLVNETLGNQYFSEDGPTTRLVVAKETFKKQDQPTDLYDVLDEIPSGKCLQVRINDATGEYDEELRAEEFRAYDPAGAITKASHRFKGDVFYVAYNRDTKRWEALANETKRAKVIWMDEIPPAANKLTQPSHGVAIILRKDENGNLYVTDKAVPVVHRCENVTLPCRHYGQVEWLEGEWTPYLSDCPGEGSSCSSESSSFDYQGNECSGYSLWEYRTAWGEYRLIDNQCSLNCSPSPPVGAPEVNGNQTRSGCQ
jgi:hypothetical protein